MALASLDLLAAILPAPTADAGALDRLALADPGAGLRITAEAETERFAERFAQRRVQTLPRPIAPPAAQLGIHCLPRRPFLRQEAPGSAGAQLVEERVENGAQGVDAWTRGRPMGDSGGKKGSRSIHSASVRSEA
jgi:hypothetical protein